MQTCHGIDCDAEVPSRWLWPGAILGFLLLVLAGLGPVATGHAASDEIPRAIQDYLAQPGRMPEVAASNREALGAFYTERGYQPLWLAGDTPAPAIAALIAFTAKADREGLRPADYRIAGIEGLLSATDPKALAALDVATSELVIRYLSDLINGRRAPRLADPELFAVPRELDLAGLLKAAAEAPDVVRFLRDKAPANPVYRRLRRALSELREIAAAGGWASLPAGATLKPGESDARVPLLRRRLEASGDISVARPAATTLYDDALVAAVVRFQGRHGLDADGAVGPKTLTALNVSIEQRIAQLVLNMERWRWMPDDLGDQYVLVNLAGFELDVVEEGLTVLSMKVVVGRTYRRSPVFTDKISYLEFNPFWTPTPNIIRNDILPKVREDVSYLASQGMRVFSDWNEGAREIDPATIDWQTQWGKRFPYKLRQDPGPKNALGRVKFMFPNKYNVYLHDTPSRDLFAKTTRTFSSGCIRVEKPLELASYLLRDDPAWSPARILRVIESGRRETASLQRKVPVHLTYSTVWIGEGGTLHFRDDIYGRDAELRKALFGAG